MKFSPTRVLLPVPHIQQQKAGECLAACAAMVLAYLNFSADYRRLVRLLHIQPGIGTPFYNIRELEKQRIDVLYKQGTLSELHNHLTNGFPCIVSVQTGELPYWDKPSKHVVVCVGMDAEFVYLNDPEFANAPVEVSYGDFDLAWFEQGESYAVLAPQ